MGYPYHFVSLDDEQNARRRRMLDSHSQFAQVSILLVPLFYHLFYGLRLLATRRKRTGYQPVKEHQSPVVSRFANPDSALKSSINVWARLRWALDEEIIEGWGTRQQWLFTGVWAVWLLVLAMKDTGDDYLHVTKRFGIIAASQIPLHYALALKSWSPIQYLTRLSHEQLNAYHRLFGRIILTFFALHASFYLNFYVQKGLLSKRIRDWDVILGLSAFTAAALLFTTALSKIRDWNYRIFFYSHVALSISLLPILYLHVSHLRVYILETAAIYALLILQRNYSQSATEATIKLLPGTNLLSINILLTKSLQHKRYTPGQHIYLGFPSLPQKLRINPFSIANPSPTTDQHIQLVARALNGTTAMLADLAKHPQPTPLLIEGPYGSATYFPDLATYDRVLFVAGGVGATFTLPLCIDLLLRGAKGEQIPPTRFVWTVWEAPDAQWGVDRFLRQCDELPEMDLYVTKTAGTERPGIDSGTKGKQPMNGEEGIELLERDGSSGSRGSGMLSTMKSGRPDLRAIVDEVFSHDANDRVAVLVCGPQGMGKNVRSEVGKWVAKGRDVFWHSEEFGW